MRYLLLRLDVTGKRPVWSVDNLPVSLKALTKTWWERAGEASGLTTGGRRVGTVLVDGKFWWYWRRWPLEVAIYLGRCSRTNLEVSAVQVV